MDKQAQELLDIARSAGQAILQVYHQDFSVQHKDDDSPLTAADLASHKVIVQRLRDMDPDTPVLSEEAAATPYETRAGWQRYW
jgi:3'(2'), 5'-bisphosphate nucleotidase